jgi:hypothetical protein
MVGKLASWRGRSSKTIEKADLATIFSVWKLFALGNVASVSFPPPFYWPQTNSNIHIPGGLARQLPNFASSDELHRCRREMKSAVKMTKTVGDIARELGVKQFYFN